MPKKKRKPQHPTPLDFSRHDWRAASLAERRSAWLTLATMLNDRLEGDPDPKLRTALEASLTLALMSAVGERRQGRSTYSREWCDSEHPGCGCACRLKAGHGSDHWGYTDHHWP